jgi:hypothetical protein
MPGQHPSALRNAAISRVRFNHLEPFLESQRVVFVKHHQGGIRGLDPRCNDMHHYTLNAGIKGKRGKNFGVVYAKVK